MACQIYFTQFAVVVMASKLQLISFFTVLILLLNTIRNINRNIFDKNDLKITETLLYGDSCLDDKSNALILNATIDFLFVVKRFEVTFCKLNMALLYILVRFIVLFVNCFFLIPEISVDIWLVNVNFMFTCVYKCLI